MKLDTKSAVIVDLTTVIIFYLIYKAILIFYMSINNNNLLFWFVVFFCTITRLLIFITFHFSFKISKITTPREMNNMGIKEIAACFICASIIFHFSSNISSNLNYPIDSIKMICMFVFYVLLNSVMNIFQDNRDKIQLFKNKSNNVK